MTSYALGELAGSRQSARFCIAAASAAEAEESGGRTSWPPSWKYDVISDIRLGLSMSIYLKKISAKFHPGPNWNDGALGFFEERRPNKKQRENNKMSSDMGVIPDPKINSDQTFAVHCDRHWQNAFFIH